MVERSLTRRDALRAGSAAVLAGLAGCSGSIGGSASTYGKWTPSQSGSGADESGESMHTIHPTELDEARHTLGDRYDAMAALLDPPVPELAFGELSEVYSNGGWFTTLFGVEAEFEQDEMVSAYQSESDAEPVDSSYEGYELLRVEGMVSSYLVGVAEGKLAVAGAGERDRAALEALVDARRGEARRVDNDGPFSSFQSAVGDESFLQIALGDDVTTQVGETTPTAVCSGFSVTDTEEELVGLSTAYVLPETVTDPEAAVESHLSAESSIGVASYSDPEVTTESGVVLATEERSVADGLVF
jgi:hypothetical protein